MSPTSKLQHVRDRQAAVRRHLGVPEHVLTAVTFRRAGEHESDPATARLLGELARVTMPSPRRR